MPVWIKTHTLWVYFVLAYALTWGASAMHLTLSRDGNVAGVSTQAQVPAALLVLLGPALAALVAAGIEQGWRGLRHLLRPLLAWKVGWSWWVFVFAYPILHHLAIAGVRWAAGGPAPRFFHNPSLPQNSIVLALAIGIGVNLVRGLGEEIGWRGFALPRLQHRRGTLAASLILGIVWALWHWHPTNANLLGWRLMIWHLLTVLPAAMLYTWLYNHVQGSLLAIVVFHMWQDVVEYIVPLGLYEGAADGLVISAAANWIVALALAAGWLRHTPDKRRVRGLDARILQTLCPSTRILGPGGCFPVEHRQYTLEGGGTPASCWLSGRHAFVSDGDPQGIE
jgi:membrane protease YdiL (CAAX protease family)